MFPQIRKMVKIIIYTLEDKKYTRIDLYKYAQNNLVFSNYVRAFYTL